MSSVIPHTNFGSFYAGAAALNPALQFVSQDSSFGDIDVRGRNGNRHINLHNLIRTIRSVIPSMLVKLHTGHGFVAAKNPHALNYGVPANFVRNQGFIWQNFSQNQMLDIASAVSELITQQSVVANGQPNFFAFLLRHQGQTILIKIQVCVHVHGPQDLRAEVHFYSRHYNVATPAPGGPLAPLLQLFQQLGI